MWWPSSKTNAASDIREQTRQKRGGGDVRGESVFLNAATGSSIGGIDQYVAEEPTPEFLAMINEEHARLLDSLPDDTLRDIAVRRMQGDSTEDIAAALNLSSRSVERKLNLIRGRWQREFDRRQEESQM